MQARQLRDRTKNKETSTAAALKAIKQKRARISEPVHDGEESEDSAAHDSPIPPSPVSPHPAEVIEEVPEVFFFLRIL